MDRGAPSVGVELLRHSIESVLAEHHELLANSLSPLWQRASEPSGGSLMHSKTIDRAMAEERHHGGHSLPPSEL